MEVRPCNWGSWETEIIKKKEREREERVRNTAVGMWVS